jgi:predicted nuclease of restriction endonuclease-like RecB superfamily
MFMSVLAVAALFGAAMYGEDITIPFEGGNILIKNASYSRYDSLLDLTRSQLRFTIVNNTSDGWDLKLQFDGLAQCDGQTRVLNRTDKVSLRPGGLGMVVDGAEHVSHGKDGGCVLEQLVPSILTAENKNLRINVVTGERIDLVKQRELAAEAQAKQDAIEEARQRRKNAELAARKAEEIRRLRENCRIIYDNTVDKKVKDLTVREEQQVRACQVLGMYPPR